MLPNIQASIHGARAPQDHVNAAALLYNIGETGVWVMVLGHTVELRHSPDSGRILLFSEAGKTSGRPGKAERFPQLQNKRKQQNYFFCKLVFLTLKVRRYWSLLLQ